MQLDEVWILYCQEHAPGVSEAMALTPGDQLALLFDHAPLFTPRMALLRATPYDPAFDLDADGALANLALSDSLAGFDVMPAGGWRVMLERYLFAAITIAAVMASGSPIMMRFPAGLQRQHRARALLLRLLLGPARTIDRTVLPRSAPGTLPPFPPGFPSTLQ